RNVGVLSLTDNVNQKIDSASTGVVALRGNNGALAPAAGYNWYLGVDNQAYIFTAASLNAGAGNTYRLGGGTLGSNGTLTLDSGGAGVLTGANNLVVGYGRSLLGGALTNGTGIVILNNPNTYTGSTLVNAGSTLAVNRALGISGAGPITVDGT